MSLIPILRSIPLLLLLPFAGHARAQAPAPGMANPPQQDTGEMQAARSATQAYYARIAPELAASGRPRELALAAILLRIATSNWTEGTPADGDVPSQPSPRDPRIDQWRQLAAARAGKDVLANALLMQADTPADASLREQAADRWRRLEPDNLAPLYFLAGPADRLLADARSTSRFDVHLYDQVRWMRSALEAHPPTAAENASLLDGEQVPVEEASTIAAMGIVTAVAIPPFKPIFDACRGDALETAPTRRADCRHVAEIMANHADSNIGELVGIGLLRSVATTPQHQADATTRRRSMDWRMQQWGKLSSEQLRGGTAQFTQLLADPTIQSEQDLVARLLAKAGIPLEPPPGWQPPRRE